MSKYITGRNSVKENIINNSPIKKVFILAENKEVIQAASINKINYEVKEKNFFYQKFPNINHQFCAAEMPDFIYSDLKSTIQNLKGRALGIILDSVEDPYNFGSIIRTAVAAGAAFIIIKNINQVDVNETVLKVSIGAAYYIKIIKVSNISNAINELKKNSFWIYGTDLKESDNLFTTDFAERSVIVLGNESKGVSRLVLENCDYKIKIPMVSKKVQSLNIGVSAGILMFQYNKKNLTE